METSNGNKKDGIILVAGNGNVELAEKISAYLKIPLTQALVGTFSDDEVRIEIKENIRLSDAFIIQSTGNSPNLNVNREYKINSPNDNIAELLLMADALHKSSARRITAVIPYYGYARQDMKIKARVPISASLWLRCMQVAGIKRMIMVELHSGQIQGFTPDAVDNLYSAPVLEEDILKRFAGKPLVIVACDPGFMKVARAYARRLRADLAVVDKDRFAPNRSKPGMVIGNVEDKIAIMLDDMIDTAGTLTDASEVVLDSGAIECYAYATHGVFSGPAVKRICDSHLKEVVVTDTLPISQKVLECGKIRVLSMHEIIGEAIIRSTTGDSVHGLFPD